MNLHFFGGYLHQYAYSPQLDLIVDPTYRQYLVDLPKGQFKKLPRVFVGTPAEFRELMGPHVAPEVIDYYLDAEAP